LTCGGDCFRRTLACPAWAVMETNPPMEFLGGVIEGFYGQPWTRAERSRLFDWMSAWGLNTYLYAPKDDPHHRAIWRQPYGPEMEAEIREIIDACHSRNIRFILAIGPGLDIRYSDPADLAALERRFGQLVEMGCRDFCLLFDDIPDGMREEDRARWGTFASAQCGVANAVRAGLVARGCTGRFLFCPTPYCGRMERAGLGGEGYLETVGRELDGAIDVFWTGPEIISREITVEHVEWLTGLLRRPPLIWDNLHANDYDGRRFYCGPYSGRPVGLKSRIRGVLTNPNNELLLNYVPFRTLAEWIHSVDEWNPREAYLQAMTVWLGHFRTSGRPIELGDLVRFGDCHYLPYEEGPEAERLLQGMARVYGTDPEEWDDSVETVRLEAVRLRDLCVRLTEVIERPLFYALLRRLWELREELDLFDRFVAFRRNPANRGQPFRSDYHLAKTYRGGWVARLQSLLVQEPDGALRPAEMRREEKGDLCA
jgi:protein O-GlcNAcase/histone acetyltransferase